MKQTEKIRRKTFGSIVLGALLLIGFTGCVKSPDTDGPGKGDENLPVFNFSTKATYPLNVKYTVPEGYKIYFEVYASDPLTTDADGKQVKNTALEPIGKGYTDTKGNYSHAITLPAYVQTLYIYTQDAGVPQLLTATVENGTLSAASLPHSATATEASTKATETPDFVSGSDFNYPNIKTLVLGTWINSNRFISVPNVDQNILWGGKARIWGRPNYLKYVDQNSFSIGEGQSAALKIDANVWNTINTVLPGEGGKAVEADVLQNGDIHNTIDDAEISLYLLDEQCLYHNVLAYYCYPTGQAPQSVSDIKTQMIALPNAKIIKSHNFPGYPENLIMEYGAMLPGEGIQLHYIDQNGVDQGTKFPAGTSIGWIIYSDGYEIIPKIDPNYFTPVEYGVIGTGRADDGPVYSDPNLMGGTPYAAVFRHGDFVITSFEDCKKHNPTDPRDYKDVILHIASNPAGAITPGVPDKDPDQPKEYDITRRGILSFEDNWPYTGDFDMNDVVVKYVSTVKYNNNNEAISTNDIFTVIWSGAKYNNSFAYENANIANGLKAFITSDEAVKYSSRDPQNANIIRVAPKVLDYANQSEKKTFSFYYEYATPIQTDNFVLPPYNPFITVGDDQTREVHLTNMKPTSIADPKYLGMGDDRSNQDKSLYFITYDEQGDQMPFAIDIVFDSEEAMNGYVIPKELKRINTYYNGFMNWIKTGGQKDMDWYLHPNE